MLSVLRRAVAVASLVAVSAGAAQAQLKVEELRVDVAGLQASGGSTIFGAGIPGGLALGIYLNDKIALEPTLNLAHISPDGGDAVTIIEVGVFAPYYLAGRSRPQRPVRRAWRDDHEGHGRGCRDRLRR